MASTKLNVLGICGSLRQGSYNRMALRASIELAPEGMAIEPFDIAPIPVYNEDIYKKGFPPPVQDFRSRIGAADALLFVTPEYNYSIPGVLKNAIDWASRPPDQPFEGKPGAIMGASPGMFGTVRSQLHLRQVCVTLNIHLVNNPEVMITRAATKFDETGRLIDEPTRKFVSDLLVALAAWTEKLRRQPS